ncbi:hypothetical protein [Tsuneonella mangrovi]|uniref:hypothetical protein n=1 Tax=Tsuneonella mangrovi TaxID=1982042 RepID=UPI000BA2602C|nr:hypothetical protein [Tsuneonella mangrovi]
MVRRVRKKTKPIQIYRHFAVVTIAATLLLAVFADGEKREAIAGEIKAHAQATSAQTHDSSVRMTAGLIDRRTGTPGTFGSDDNIGYGQPTDTGGASIGDSGFDPSYSDPDSGSGGQVMPTGINKYGISDADWAKMSTAQRKEIIDRYNAERKAEASDTRQQQIADLMAQSSARSGN